VRPAFRAGWVCETVAMPSIKWYSSTDQTADFPIAITCTRLEERPPGTNDRDWLGWFKILRNLEFPF
jgi:hypothetical protein